MAKDPFKTRLEIAKSKISKKKLYNKNDNPSPICVLDEVDAPLDDANVTRFCSLLEELIKITNTKFIIVTHHALTMSKMNRLYGVTMPQKGISQLVAVDLQKAESMVA